MKQFFKFFTASCLGTLVAFFLFFAIIVGIGITIASSSFDKEEKTIKENSVFKLELAGQVEERYVEDYYSMLLDETSLPMVGLNDMLTALENAKNDKKVKGVYVDCGIFSCGFSSARAIREALLDFKESGKFVVAYGGVFTQATYYIASAADKVIVNPVGSVEWKGLASQQFFYKGLFDKIGVEVEVVKVGKFKSFAEQFTNTTISPENEYQLKECLNSLWGTMLKEVSDSRNLSVQQLNMLADSAVCFDKTEEVLAAGLVDSMLYVNEMLDFIAELSGEEKADDLNFVTLRQMKQTPEQKNGKSKIAVVYAVGSIDDQISASDDGIDSEKLVKLLADISKDDDVKGVVLRVNSPGGSAYGAEQIWQAISLLQEKKPVVVSMGDYAASGGYYISCLADKIYADPTTVTGSIGIFGVIPNFGGLMEKVGVANSVVKTNDKSDILSGVRSFTPSERVLLQSYVDNGYELFVKRCAEGRHLSVDSIKAIAEGRVWTGEMARKIGLVDELGGLPDAVEDVARRCGMKDYEICEYPELDDFMTQIVNSLDGSVQTSIMKKRLGENYIHYKTVQRLKSMKGAQALLPIEISME